MILITFNYNLSDFLNNTQIMSQYRTQTTFNSGGEAGIDDVKLTADDESLITKFLKGACVKIADVLSGYTKLMFASDGETELPAYEFNVTYDTLPGQIVFRINMPDTFLLSTMNSMEDCIKDALENYVIYRTTQLRGTEFQSYLSQWDDGVRQLRAYLSRRTQVVTRSMNHF